MAAAAPNVDLPSEAIVNTTGAAEQSRPQNSAGSSKFEVVVDSKVENPEEYVTLPKIEDDLDDEVIEPAYYYENMGVPVFTPTMDQFRSFKRFVDKINHYGMQSGIVKIIPPKEWVDSLPPLDEKVKDIKIKNPIEQHIAGISGEYRQTNLEKGRTFNLPEWRHVCEGSEHQPPARRGERRKGREPRARPPVSRTTRNRKSTAAAKDDEAGNESINKTSPPTPTSPGKATDEKATARVADRHGRQPRTTAGAEPTPEPVTDAQGRQPRAKRVHKTARQRAADREVFDEAWFEGFDYRISDAESYTPERCEELEKAYWRTLTYNNPMYGADMPGSLFDDSVKSWNVAHLENILDCLGKKLPGVNTAYLYMGMWKATFAWHLEDMDLYSINYIHFGAPKQWYSISRKDKERFEHVMKTIYPNDAKKCSEFLRHKTFLVSPSILAQHGIKVNKLVHHQHEFVITFPFGYHSGYNLGYNCAESVNFATHSWLDYGRNAKKCECIDDAVFLDVKEIERKLRGEPTDDEEEFDSDDSDEDDTDDEEGGERIGDFPTPPESVEGKPGKIKLKRSHKRKAESGDGKTRRVKIRLKAPVREPCILCPNDIPSEPLLPTETGEEAHRLCAIYTPETFFRKDDANEREVIAGVANVPKARLELKCYFCRMKKGSCFQCSAKKCTRAYHATCAAAAGVLVNMVDVDILGEDGKSYPQTHIDYRCRFHRPKRPKNIDAVTLEDDRLIHAFAESLIKHDVIQMQYLQGEIFAGVVIENRKEEGTVLVRTLPKEEMMEVEWKWILAQDPSQTTFPDAILTAPLFPADEFHAANKGDRARRELPLPDDEFIGDYTWGELIVENIKPSSEQARVNDKDWWFYLGEQSTECIAKYTEDPTRRVYNEEGDFIKKKPPRPKSHRPTTVRYELTYTGGYPHQQMPPYGFGHTQHQPVYYQHHMSNGNPTSNYSSSPFNPGYRPQFNGAPAPMYTTLNNQQPPQASHQLPPMSMPSAPSGSPSYSGATQTTGYQQHPPPRPPFSNGFTQCQRPPQQEYFHPSAHQQQPSSPYNHDQRRFSTSITQATQSTPVVSPITPVSQWNPTQQLGYSQAPQSQPQRTLPSTTGPPASVLSAAASLPPTPQSHHPISRESSAPSHEQLYRPPARDAHMGHQLPPILQYPLQQRPGEQQHAQQQSQQQAPMQQQPQHAPPSHNQPGITDIKAALAKLAAAKAAAGTTVTDGDIPQAQQNQQQPQNSLPPSATQSGTAP